MTKAIDSDREVSRRVRCEDAAIIRWAKRKRAPPVLSQPPTLGGSLPAEDLADLAESVESTRQDHAGSQARRPVWIGMQRICCLEGRCNDDSVALPRRHELHFAVTRGGWHRKKLGH